MRDSVRQRRQAEQHAEFLQCKVAAARASLEAGRGRSNVDVEAEFAARREQLTRMCPPIQE